VWADSEKQEASHGYAKVQSRFEDGPLRFLVYAAAVGPQPSANLERIALMRTAVVAGNDLTLMEEQRNVLALEFHHDGTRRAQPIELNRAVHSATPEVRGRLA